MKLKPLQSTPRCWVVASLSFHFQDTHPASSTTGAWSKPFSLRILMVFWQVTVGRTVRGADTFKPCSFRFHHLMDREEREGLTQPHMQEICTRREYSLVLHIPGFFHHEVLFTQEALLDHPLVTQELGPWGGKKLRFASSVFTQMKEKHLKAQLTWSDIQHWIAVLILVPFGEQLPCFFKGHHLFIFWELFTMTYYADHITLIGHMRALDVAKKVLNWQMSNFPPE